MVSGHSLIRAGACLLLAARLAFAQQPAAGEKPRDRGAAYYHYSLGHLYEQLAREYRSNDHLNKAIEEYRLALQADPGSELLSSELVDLYANAGRLQDAVAEAEAVLQRDPKSLEMRRLLGRIYRGYLADPAQGKLNEELLRRAVDQYERIVAQDPKDLESHLHLAALYRVSRDSVKAEKALKAALELDPNSEEALTNLAELYSQLGDTNGAIEMLSRVAEKNPRPRILAALGAAYQQANQPEKAVEALERAVQQDRSNVEARRLLARNLFLSEKYEKALEHYQVLVKSDPQDPENYLRISQIHRQKRNFEQARGFLQKAAALAPAELIEVPYNEALLYEAEGKIDQAVATLQKVLESSAKSRPADYSARERSNRAYLLEKVGMLERNRENFPAAEKAFRAMMEADSESAPRAGVQLIETARAARDFRRALAESESVFKKYPEDRSVAVVRASVLADMGEARQGAQILRGLLKNSAEDREILLALAQVLEKGKLWTEAREAVDRAMGYSQTKDQKRSVHFTYGSLLERQKQYDEAEKHFRAVLEIDPEDASALNYLGYMLADRNLRLEEAFRLIKKAVDMEPENGAYLDSLGWVYYRQNKLDLAEDYLKRSLAKAPRDPTVHDHLGDVYSKQGKIRLAQEQWQRSLREWESSSKSEINPEEIARIRKKLDAVKVRLAQEQGAKTGKN
jgi:tetratricopeptide (TPR) repeat protein